MTFRMILFALATVGGLSFTAFSQSIPDPPLPAPSQTTGENNKVNLNTASAEELARLPRLGRDSVSAIIKKRKTAPFKDWSDFVARRIVPSFSISEIKGRVTF
jgi:DNA uptake protein ComE-like DNA-binding protein